MKLNFHILFLLSFVLVICFSLETQDEGEYQLKRINKNESNEEEVDDEILEPEMFLQEFLDEDPLEEPCKASGFLRRNSDSADTVDSSGLLDMLGGVADIVNFDSVWHWIGGSNEPEIGEDYEVILVEKNGEDIIQGADDDKLYFKAVKPYKENKEESSSIQDENSNDYVASITQHSDEVLQIDQEIITEKNEIPEEMMNEINEIDEIVLTVSLDDILGATNHDDIETIVESKEPFYIRVYELFMGRETQVGIHNAEFYQPKNQTEGERLRFFLKDDGL